MVSTGTSDNWKVAPARRNFQVFFKQVAYETIEGLSGATGSTGSTG